MGQRHTVASSPTSSASSSPPSQSPSSSSNSLHSSLTSSGGWNPVTRTTSQTFQAPFASSFFPTHSSWVPDDFEQDTSALTLPRPVQERIVTYLSFPKDACSLAQTCKYFRTLVDLHPKWQEDIPSHISAYCGEQDVRGKDSYRIFVTMEYEDDSYEKHLEAARGFNHVERSLKVILLGGAGSGKTTLLSRMIHNEYPAPTNMLNHGSRLFIRKRKVVGVEVWEGCPEAPFDSARAFVLLYDVCSEKSLRQLESLAEIHLLGAPANRIIAVVGTKQDAHSKREVSPAQGNAVAVQLNADLFLEVSCKTGRTVEHLLYTLVKKAKTQRAKKES